MTSLKYVFIIPYRDRIEHKTFFDYYMKFILEDYDEETYFILYCHQNDKRKFNRGAMKNIGFLYMKKKYPQHYKDFIFIFNDVDSIPYTKNLLNYDICKNEIKHYYGYDFALGGIFAITGEDFEKINGFPNYWGWGFEDSVIYKRATSNGLIVNRNQFFDINSHQILHFCDDFRKFISQKAYNNSINKTFTEIDGLNTIKNLNYNLDKNMLNIDKFSTYYKEDEETYIEHTIFDGVYAGGNKPNKNKKNNNFMNLFSKSKSLI